MKVQVNKQGIMTALAAGVLVWTTAPAGAANVRVERHFAVQGRPVVVLQNIGDGRIEVKSSKNAEVVVSGTRASDKISIEMEQVGDRIDVNTNVLDPSAQPAEMQANLQLVVPEETELQLKTQTG